METTNIKITRIFIKRVLKIEYRVTDSKPILEQVMFLLTQTDVNETNRNPKVKFRLLPTVLSVCQPYLTHPLSQYP